ncbi:MAG TPA: hypothetical protein VFW40_11100 [Capsulimonadaceae bacterium]|nr:hypothetical protein [Capsulimonadaceae bacterium]
MKYLPNSIMRSVILLWVFLGIAAALSGCGSRTDTSPGAVSPQPASPAAQSDAHVPPAAVAGQAQYGRQRQAAAQGYAASMKQMAKQQHK